MDATSHTLVPIVFKFLCNRQQINYRCLYEGFHLITCLCLIQALSDGKMKVTTVLLLLLGIGKVNPFRS